MTAQLTPYTKPGKAFPGQFAKVNKEQAYIMALEGKSYADIARHFNVTPQAISKHLTPLRNRIETYLAYKDKTDILFEEYAIRSLNAVDEDTIKKHQSRGITDAAIAIDKMRLLRDQSTANVASVHLDIAELRKMGADLGACKIPCNDNDE